MPELPEVETTRRGIAPHLLGRRVQQVLVRQPQLRWPVPADLAKVLHGQTFVSAERRAKYLLLGIGSGHLLWHLGMSGSLRIVLATTPVKKHDHIDIVLDDGNCLRFTDPRRFGALLWTAEAPAVHPLLQHLGPEPLSLAFNGEYLYSRSHGRKTAVKSFLMDGRIVVGVGNIYANEALFLAGISPLRAAGRISLPRYNELVAAVRGVLEAAIRQGGTTLRDYVGGSGEPGYFRQQLRVYERTGLPCLHCAEPIRVCRLAQRSTYYCTRCQH